MTDGISATLTFAVGVAVSPVPIIAVILMLFSRRARVNGPVFLLGWVGALAIVSAVAFNLADATGTSASDDTTATIAWGRVVLGVLLLLAALRNWRSRPAPGEQPEMPRWMAGIDELTPPKALGLGLLLAGVNPKNLILTVGAATSVSELGLSGADASASLIIFGVLASTTIGVPVGYHLIGGASAAATLDRLKDWLGFHHKAVMAVLLLIFGIDLIAQGLPGI